MSILCEARREPTSTRSRSRSRHSPRKISLASLGSNWQLIHFVVGTPSVVRLYPRVENYRFLNVVLDANRPRCEHVGHEQYLTKEYLLVPFTTIVRRAAI